MTDNLYSVRNELRADVADRSYLELNPAVVSTRTGPKYALSAVCVGPRINTEDRKFSLEVSCDGERAVLEAVHHQTEETEADEWLTVALFSVSRSLLEGVVSARIVQIDLHGGATRLSRNLDAENKLNVRRFLNRIYRHPTQSLPGRAAVAVGAVA